mgnify:CR=1 FL=1|jgi:hypothetical protein
MADRFWAKPVVPKFASRMNWILFFDRSHRWVVPTATAGNSYLTTLYTCAAEEKARTGTNRREQGGNIGRVA